MDRFTWAGSGSIHKHYPMESKPLG
jgi:hypothetical protein